MLYASLLVGVLLAMLDIQVTNAILPILGRDLGASIAQLGTVQTIYLSAEVISILSARALTRSFPSKKVFIVACFGFALASAACSVSPTLWLFLVARFFQGLFAGAMVPIASEVRFRIFPKERQAVVGSVVILVLTAAPTFGPSIGAWIAEAASWRLIFSLNVPIAIAVALNLMRAPDYDNIGTTSRPPLPWSSIVYLIVFAVCGHMAFELTVADPSNWLDGRIPLMVLATANLSLLLLESRTGQPMLSMKPIHSPQILLLTLASGLLTAVQISLNFSIPLYIQTVAGSSIDEAAKVLLIGGLSQMLGAPLLWLLLDVIGLRGVLCLGLTLLFTATAMLCRISPDWTLPEFATPQVLRGLSYMLIATPTQTVLMTRVSSELQADANVILSAVRNIGAMLGVSSVSLYLLRSYDEIIARGGVVGYAFDPAVGTDTAGAARFWSAAENVGFQDVMMATIFACFLIAITSLPAAWRHSEQTAG